MDIELDKSNCFCFDSEAFRFLACIQVGVEFPEEDVEVFSSSWHMGREGVSERSSHIFFLFGILPETGARGSCTITNFLEIFSKRVGV